jgi:hypothetical protein
MVSQSFPWNPPYHHSALRHRTGALSNSCYRLGVGADAVVGRVAGSGEGAGESHVAA